MRNIVGLTFVLSFCYVSKNYWFCGDKRERPKKSVTNSPIHNPSTPSPHRHTTMAKQQHQMKKSARGGGKGKTKAEAKQNKKLGIYSSKHIRQQQEKTANSLAKGNGKRSSPDFSG